MSETVFHYENASVVNVGLSKHIFHLGLDKLGLSRDMKCCLHAKYDPSELGCNDFSNKQLED